MTVMTWAWPGHYHVHSMGTNLLTKCLLAVSELGFSNTVSVRLLREGDWRLFSGGTGRLAEGR